MTIPDELKELWQQHSSAAFPKGYGGREIDRLNKRLSGLKANTSPNLGGEWVEKADFIGEPVKLVVQA